MMKKTVLSCMTFILSLFAFAGCSNSESSQMANELRFSLKGISSLTISYDEEKVTFLESDGDDLVIKEYMTENKSSYYAKVTEHNESIRISEGGKPFFKNIFSRSIEVYLPESYHENLTVTSTDGDIDFTGMSLDLTMLRVDNSSGNVTLDHAAASDIYLSSARGTFDLGSIEANQIRLETTGGSVTCAELNGNVTYTSSSGNADIKSAIGSGSYKANNSGSLNVVYSEVNGDLFFFSKNGKITLTLPENLEFVLQATTKNGSLSTTFQQDITVDGPTAGGVVGDNPAVTVRVETNNGDIEVIQ
ncbi:DUF4097 family beta strand repeat-containing protein [Lachnospiraceae bacterium 54-53]